MVHPSGSFRGHEPQSGLVRPDDDLWIAAEHDFTLVRKGCLTALQSLPIIHFRGDLLIKADLARTVYETHGGISQKEAREIVDLIIAHIKNTLISGQNVKLSGFGSINLIHRRARAGRNPQTGNRIRLKASKYVTFRPSKKVF